MVADLGSFTRTVSSECAAPQQLEQISKDVNICLSPKNCSSLAYWDFDLSALKLPATPSPAVKKFVFEFVETLCTDASLLHEPWRLPHCPLVFC